MHNTPNSFGLIARSLHWLTALLILTAIPLGLYANGLPFDTAEAAAHKAQIFSLHKSLGVAAFFTAFARIIYAVSQARPAPLHPDRKLETFVAETVHWMLYVSMLAVPLTGWVHHAATSGFAPILWPFGQDLPFVPKSESVSQVASLMHWVFGKLLFVSVILHVAGAVKHAVIDRDDTLNRMVFGTEGGKSHTKTALPLIAAAAIYAAGTALAVAMIPPAADIATQTVANQNAAATAAATTAGNWQVSTGTLGFSVKQMGTDVPGTFATWTADISFDPAATSGNHVTVTIDTSSLTLGSVTDQAKEPEFFDIKTHPTAVFTADITPDGANYLATGSLTLRGETKPMTLPFSLTIDGDTATMQGTTTLDRRSFGMGPSYPDEATIAFPVQVTVALTATRK